MLLVAAGNKFINLAMLARAFLALPLQELEIDNLSEQIIVPDRTNSVGLATVHADLSLFMIIIGHREHTHKTVFCLRV